MTSSHRVHRDLAWALKQQAARTGQKTPAVRGSDWRLATVTTVNTDGTVIADGITARRMESYQSAAVGDVIVLSRSSSGNWVAWGRMASGSDAGWVKPALATGFAHDGNTNGDVRYRPILIGGTLFLQWRGGVGITYASNAIQNSGDILATPLPAALRPPSTRTVTAACSAGGSSSLSLKVDGRPDGQLRIVGTTTATTDTYSTPIIRPGWVSLNGLQYPLDA
ncbi:hypothetical protein [Streptomyces sp. NPDC014793]|uniref:hypothetical protein n=1 Tax=Streptomyces sp. NPDC014793 TaxID=3364914 RepID=UPI0036FB48D3